MAILSCLPKPGHSVDQNEKFESTYTVVFQVASDTLTDGPKTIIADLSTIGVKVGKPYNVIYDGVAEMDAGAICRSLSVRNTSQGPEPLWEVTATFGPWDPIESVQNPLNELVLPTIETITIPKPVYFDSAGKPLLNTAGEVTEAEGATSHTVMRFSQNYATLPAIFPYVNYINNATWQGFAPFVVKFNAARAEELTSQFLASTYWRVDYEFEANGDLNNSGAITGWLSVVLNAGYYQKVGGVLKPCLVNGQPVSTPVPLDASGVQIGVPSFSNVQYNTYHVLQEIDFNTIFTAFPTNLFAVYPYPT